MCVTCSCMCACVANVCANANMYTIAAMVYQGFIRSKGDSFVLSARGEGPSNISIYVCILYIYAACIWSMSVCR